MAKKPKPPKAPGPPKAPKRKRSARERFGYWLLVLGTVLGVAAGVSYAVPIPGLTAAVGATEPVATPDQSDKPKDAPKEPSAAEQQQADLDAREVKLKEKEAQVSTLLKDLTTQKATLEPLQQAAAMYQNMAPFKAGPMMESLDPVQAARILKLIDEDQAGAIVSYMQKTKGAQVMTELIKLGEPAGN